MKAREVMALSILELGPVIFGDTDSLIQYLQGKQLIASNKSCSCGAEMRLGNKADVSDGKVFRCPSCKRVKSLRAGSFFDKSRLSLQKWIVLLYWWVREYPVTDAAEEAQVGRDTAINVYQWLREVCSTRLLSIDIKLGGQGKVVQIDESLFRHKVKYHRGQSEVWVFGMVDTSKQPAMGYMVVVPNRTAITLLPIIEQHVHPGTGSI